MLLLLIRRLRPLTVGPVEVVLVVVVATAEAAAALAAATAAMAAEVTEDELATGDAPVVAEAGDGFVNEENVVITQRAAPEDWPSSEGQTKSLLLLAT